MSEYTYLCIYFHILAMHISAYICIFVAYFHLHICVYYFHTYLCKYMYISCMFFIISIFCIDVCFLLIPRPIQYFVCMYISYVHSVVLNPAPLQFICRNLTYNVQYCKHLLRSKGAQVFNIFLILCRKKFRR